MSSKSFLKTASYFHSGIVTGVFCSSFVAEITKEGGVKFKQFYRAPSFYILVGLLVLEFIKNIIVKRDAKIRSLNAEIAELKALIEQKEQLEMEASWSPPVLDVSANLSVNETITYAQKKIIETTSNRMSRLIEMGEMGEEFEKLNDVLDRVMRY